MARNGDFQSGRRRCPLPGGGKLTLTADMKAQSRSVNFLK